MKNTNISHIIFELNLDYYFHVFFKYETNPYPKYHLANKIAEELRYIWFVI